MKLKNLKIETLLKVGFFTILVLILALGGLSWIQADKLEQQTIELYEHPFTVANSLGKLKSDVLDMQLKINELNSSKNKETISDIHQKLEVLKANAFKQFDVIYSRYKGKHTDVDKAYDHFVKWNTICDETLTLFREGKTEEARNSTESEGIGGQSVALLFKDIKILEDFAQNYSNHLFLESSRVKDQLNIQLIYWVTAILFAILMLFIGLFRSIHNPLVELNSALKLFTNGNLDARSKLSSNNEFGILSDSFNELADTVQEVRELNGKAIKLDQLMLSEEEAHRFCHKLLSALLKDTWSQMGAVYLLNEDETKFEYFECIGMIGAACKPFSAIKYEGEFGQALATRKMQHITNIPDDSRFTFATVTGAFMPREIITIPVLTGNEVMAVITLVKVKKYSENSLKLLNMIQGTLNARMGGILANRKILAFSQKLEYQNLELESQKNELSAQTNELVEQNIELEMQKKQLDESNKLKTSFLSNMSHELRTPLNSVIALSGVLNRRLSGKVPDEEYSYLEVIERNGKNLLLLINDILDLSRIEAGREEINISTFNVQHLIGEIVEMIDPQAKQKDITLRHLSNNDLPDIKCDYDKLRHILQNIIGNAVKFTEEGYVEITTYQLGKDFCIKVTDTGIGIQEESVTAIFEEFRQADGSNSRKYGGTGLGLTIAKKYAEILGGRIDVKSTYGEGSQFVLFLPIIFESNQLNEDSDQDVFLSSKYIIGKNIEEMNKSDKTILIVEDTDAVVIQMKDILESLGYNLMVANNGSDALELISQKIPDGMILDLMMPGVDGFDVLKQIREEKKTENIPVIILTAKYVTKNELSFLKSNNIHQLIQKGDINKEQLLKAVASMVYVENEDKNQLKERPVPVLGKPVVLVVEDNSDNMLTIKALLSGRCEVIEAEDGKMGIEKTYRYHPDLILMDIALPGINGIEVLNELRKDSELNHTPIIAVSASAMKGDQEKLMSYGFDGYISKPIDDKQFFKIIEEWIGKI